MSERVLIKKMTAFQIDNDLLAAVDKAAARRNMSRSAFIRKALERVVAGEPDAS